jgi:glycosyltransferase involved in cell wall biosynthesis
VRISIDLRKLHDYGIGTYIRNLVIHLARTDKDTDYVLLCRPQDKGFVESLGENFRALSQTDPLYSMREQLRIPAQLRRAKVDVFHAPHYTLPFTTPCNSVVTIHDCIHLLFPQYLPSRVAYIYARTALWIAANRSSRVLTVSEASKKDILSFFNIDPEKITVIPNGIDGQFMIEPSTEAIARVQERYQLKSPFLLYVGNVKPHKNLERLIDAFFKLRKDGLTNLTLLIIGDEITKYTTIRRTVHRYQLHKYVRFLGFVPSDTLSILYRLADAFVFPSLYEGFGLPPLEAMASGTPVVTSNVSSLPEVVGNAAVLVDPYDVNSIANGIQTILEDPLYREKLTKNGLERAKHYSWERSVAKVKQIYGELSTS